VSTTLPSSVASPIPTTALPRSVVLVGNPDAGHTRDGLEHARHALEQAGLTVCATVHMDDLEQLEAWVARPTAERPLILAAGGDGTVGAVAGYVANTDAILGILPLGTSNDIARSLGIPMRLEDAVHLLTEGKVSTSDIGQFIDGADGSARYFMHAAAMGIDVAFAKMATQTSLRKRLGRLTYAVAALLALRDFQSFECEVQIEERRISLRLIHLSVVNAPIFGGRWNFRLAGSELDDRRLDVLALDDVPPWHFALAIWPLLFRKNPHVGGVRLYHARRMRVHSEKPLDITLDGEVVGRIPGDFQLLAGAVRVVTGRTFRG